MTAPNDEDRKTVMVLTDREWRLLANLCEDWKKKAPDSVRFLPETAALADRIMKAVDE